MGKTEMSLLDWQGCPAIRAESLIGHYVRLEVLDWLRHGQGLFDALCGDKNEALWRYLPLECPQTLAEFKLRFDEKHNEGHWLSYVFCHAHSHKVLGMASYMRHRPKEGSVEIGMIAFGPDLSKTVMATEGLYLMAHHAFEAHGYRRLEWKCNNDNEPSKRAALRLGFVYEGLFRQDQVVKGLNRDTAWFSIIDQEWPPLKARFKTWLKADNFDGLGQQITALNDLS